MQADSIPYGYCHCGCGQKTRIAERNRNAIGHVKGQPLRFIQHHCPPVPMSSETRAKIGAALSGQRSYSWRGDKASYRAIHSHLTRYHPKTGICEQCGAEAKTDYALVHGHRYTRDRHDYLELCRPCHVQYDLAGKSRSAATRAKISETMKRGKAV